MMKTTIKLMAMMLGIFAVAFGTTSCDKINDALEEHDPNDVKSVNVEYSMDLSQTWFEFYDITVTYYDENGKEHSQTVTEKWEYGFSVKPNKAPKNYVFTVVATPKKEHPEFDKAQYILSEDIQAKFYGIRYNGSIYQELWSDLHPVTLTWTDIYTFNESQMESYFVTGARNLASFTHSFDGDY
ncbi:MAG: hypothetical protein K2H22_00170 [Muribaculaceae bacterium]|nr:hypothetical protein [Muribaculaceae bacterium]